MSAYKGMWWPLLCGGFLLGGCSSGSNDLMPLADGARWNYLVKTVSNDPDEVAVKRRVAVGDVQGYELAGPMGVSDLAWSHGRLVTDRMANTRFIPPLVILAPNEKVVRWRGWVFFGDTKQAAKATIMNSNQRLDIVGRTVDTVKSVVSVSVKGQSIDLTTWFESGLGIVRQEQRTGGRVDLILEYLGRA